MVIVSIRMAFCSGCGQPALIINDDWSLLIGHARRQHPELRR